MNWRGFGALVQREVRRGRRRMLGFLVLGLVATLLTLFMPGEIAMLPASLSALAGLAVIFSPLADLRADKTQGYLEFDRVLPIAHRMIGAARLLGSAVRTVPIILLALPVVIALDRGRDVDLAMMMVALAIPLAAWLILTAMMWTLMAINIRWNFRRLWWLPMTLAFAPRILVSMLPDAAKAALADAAARAGDGMAAFAASPAGVITIAVLLVALPIAGFLGAISLYAAGLERYTHDESAAVPVHTAPPRREMGAVGRGPLLAVTRYCIRLGSEQSRQRLIVLLVLIGVLLLGSATLRGYAQFYVRTLAALIPGGVVLQLGAARARGHLEGMQQLPHPAKTIAAGYFLAIAALSVPGAAVWVLARAVTGQPPTATNVISLFAWLVMWTWLACVASIWLTSRRAAWIAAVAIATAAAWALYAGFGGLSHAVTDAAERVNSLRLRAGAIFPIMLSAALVAGALPLFARGLSEYEKK